MGIENLGRILVIHKGEYNPATAYVPMDEVSYNGSTYRCYVACTGVVPTTTSKWRLVASGGVGQVISKVEYIDPNNLQLGQSKTDYAIWSSGVMYSTLSLANSFDWSRTIAYPTGGHCESSEYVYPTSSLGGKDRVNILFDYRNTLNPHPVTVVEFTNAFSVQRTEYARQISGTGDEIVTLPGVVRGKSMIIPASNGRYLLSRGFGDTQSGYVSILGLAVDADNTITVSVDYTIYNNTGVLIPIQVLTENK